VAKLRKNVRFSVILVDGRRFPKIVRAPAGRRMPEALVEAVLTREAELVEKHFPGREFRLVPLASGDFNFVEMGKEEAELRARHSELHEKYTEAAAV